MTTGIALQAGLFQNENIEYEEILFVMWGYKKVVENSKLEGFKTQ